MNYIANAGSLVVNTLIGLYLYVVLLRFWMQWMRVDFRNPVGQFVISATNPVIVPLRKIFSPIGSVDTATLLFAFIVATVKVWALLSLAGLQASLVANLVYGFSEVLRSSIHIFIAAILVTIIASWVASGSYNPVVTLAHQIAGPIMEPARRLIPPMGGLDLSPILVFLFLNLTLTLIVAPISPFF